MRTYRIRSGLTQKDAAALLGMKTGTAISKTEKSIDTPSLQVLLGYCVLFEAAPQELAPGVILKIEKAVFSRIHLLEAQLQKRPQTSTVLARLAFLEKLSLILERHTLQNNDQHQ